MADHHSHGNASPSHAAHSRTKTLRPRGLNDDLQLLAGTEDGHFEDVSVDVDVAVVLDEVANNKQIGIRWVDLWADVVLLHPWSPLLTAEFAVTAGAAMLVMYASGQRS